MEEFLLSPTPSVSLRSSLSKGLLFRSFPSRCEKSMASITKPELRFGLKEDFKFNLKKRDRQSFSWIGGPARPHSENQLQNVLFIEFAEKRKGDRSGDSFSHIWFIFVNPIPLFHALRIFFEIGRSFSHCHNRTVRCYTNDLISGQVLLCD